MQVGAIDRDSARCVEVERLSIACSIDELKVLAGFFEHLLDEVERLYGDGVIDEGAHFHLQHYCEGLRGADSDIAVVLLAEGEK